MSGDRLEIGEIGVRPPRLAASSPTERLHLYLADHLAGAQAGTALARHCQKVHRASPTGPAWARLADDIEQDFQWLQQILSVLGISPSRLKHATAVVVERASRLKPNGQVLGRSPLSDLLELEALSAGVAGKRSLWLSLAASLGTEPLRTVSLDELVVRADEQLALLDSIRPALATAALA